MYTYGNYLLEPSAPVASDWLVTMGYRSGKGPVYGISVAFDCEENDPAEKGIEHAQRATAECPEYAFEKGGTAIGPVRKTRASLLVVALALAVVCVALQR